MTLKGHLFQMKIDPSKKAKRGPLPRKFHDFFLYVNRPQPGKCPVKFCQNLSGKGKGALCHKHHQQLFCYRNPEAAILHRARGHAKARGIPFHLTKDEFMEICRASGFDFRTRPSEYKEYPSLDRIDATKPYERGNVQIITVSANAIKAQRERRCGYYFGAQMMEASA